jgi:light-regulated signal transduction histidine kinase (bacteriophytochrome)
MEDSDRSDDGRMDAEDELDAKVRERTAALQASNEDLEWFAYSLTHDLRSALTTAGMAVDLLRRGNGGKLDPVNQTVLGSLANSVQKMKNMVDSTLKLARLSRSNLERRTVQLSAIAHRIIDEMRQADPGRTVAVTVAPGIETVGDELLLSTALENLLANAWKFTSKAKEPCIRFGAEIHDGEQVFFVSDNGVGFDPKHKGKLFTAFSRLHSQNDFAGTGIGLATVKRIVDRHGGRIWAEGAVGRGATFYIALPQHAPTPVRQREAVNAR